MIAGIRRPPISQKRKAMALVVAGAADFIQIMLLPLFVEGGASPLNDVIDIATAILLTAICSFRWQFVLTFMFELIPGLDLLPTWSAVALLIPSQPAEVFVSVPPRQTQPKYPVLEARAVVVTPIQPPPENQFPNPTST